MGHRALVAYEQGPNTYDIHYSHWGAVEFRLIRNITPATPYADGDVREDPEARMVSLREILDEYMQYFSYEAFYIVDRDGEVTAWVPVEYEAGRGACLPVRTYEEDGQEFVAGAGQTRGYMEGVMETAEDMQERGVFDDFEEVIEYVHKQARARYMGSTGRAATYDEPMLSSEDSIPPQYRADTISVSEIMADGGQKGLEDY